MTRGGLIAVLASAAAVCAALAPPAFGALERNAGQAGPRAFFMARSAAGVALLERGGVVVTRGGRGARGTVTMRPLRARPVVPVGARRLRGVVNSYTGARSRWRTGVPTFSRVRYPGLYPGIDLVFHQRGDGRLEYDFSVQAGTPVTTIGLRVSGGPRPHVDRRGALVLGAGVREQAPRAWQAVAGRRVRVEARWRVRGRVASIAVGRHDMRRALTIDPAIVYSSFLGGSGNDVSHSVALDALGDSYVSGYSQSANFPTALAAQPGFGGGDTDAFVAKLDPAGHVIYSTYLGGLRYDTSDGVAADAAGDAYVTGRTGSTDFPTRLALQPAFAGGGRDAFVTKLTPTGALTWSTYLGGTGFDRESGIAVDGAGAAYVTGHTTSTDYPTASALRSSNAGSDDAVVTKLSPDGQTLDYSTYLGSTGVDEGGAIAVDGSGSAYVAGHTSSPGFPTAGAAQPAYGGGGYDGVAFRLSPNGQSLVYSTFLGGSGTDYSDGIAVDAGGSAYIASEGTSANLPLRAPVQATSGGGYDAYATKLDPGGSLVYQTYLGGSGDDVGRAVAADSAGNGYYAGDSESPNFPVANANQPTWGGSADVFVTQIAPSGGAMPYSTYLGGPGSDVGYGIVLDGRGGAFVSGSSSSATFPVTPDAAQARNAGATDAFLLRLDLSAPTPPPPAVSQTPPPPPPPPDLRLSGATVQHPLRKRRVYLVARVSQQARVRITGSVRIRGMRHALRLRTVVHSLPANRGVRLYLAVTRKDLVALRGALQRGAHAVARLSASARGAGGLSRTRHRAVRLKR